MKGAEVIWNEQREIAALITGMTWSGDIVQAPRRLEFNLRNTTNGENRALPLAEGDTIRWLQDGQEQFRGILFSSSRNGRAEESWVAYDESIYLTRNTDSRRIRRQTATQFIRELCADFHLQTGELDDTGYVIPDLKMANQSLWNMMVMALTETAKQNQQRFHLQSREGKLHLVNRSRNVLQWMLRSGSTLLDISATRSIEEMSTRVKVVASDRDRNPVEAVREDAALVARYGLMQHLESVDPEMTRSEMDQLARSLLAAVGKVQQQTEVEAIGNLDVLAGKLIYVKDALTETDGAFYVSSDSHTIGPTGHRMRLTLSFTDDLPSMEADQAG
ncbi:hypothetical protein DUZ99_08775 [Xylanibacillus composti]|uniref:YqbQ/XkdQ domain-containing protein n=1 Tax=Xylanibacillus composti TaxID=1572762 RepID=A0A8J4H4W9_9BACL|nr:hypothetical protein [Xylanibacillus composti]MDT9725089.1 hypothetical protein [Xylanibacillus composti]GIQ70904.1 hypothetical protein XYCOK13_37280 [Xylanibacillus composti]